MAYTNTRTKVSFATYGSYFSYYVFVSSASVFSGKYNVASGISNMDVDITDILKPYVHAEEITSLTSGSGPTSAPYSVTALGASITSGSTGTLLYLNDFATASIPSPVRPQNWDVASVAGQFYFSYSAQGSWTGSQYGSTPDTCQYNAEIIFTDPFGMPQGIPVKATTAVDGEWAGYDKAQDFQSKKHRLTPLSQEKQMTFTCYTPNLKQQHRKRIVRWLGQAEYVYLYDIDEGQLYPCVTPQTADANGRIAKLTINLVTAY